jgi:hypothetical protein
VQLSLLGTGLVRVKHGASPQVGNDFSQDVANARWNDVQVDQRTILPAEMRDIFQSFVNRGVLREPDRVFVGAAQRGGPVARISGVLDRNRVARIGVEPEMVGFVRELLKIFDDQRPAQAKPPAR